MNIMKKCGKFHKDSLRSKKVKLLSFNLLSVIELSETADFVYNFVCSEEEKNL